eukprot:Opistho-1_new@109134
MLRFYFIFFLWMIAPWLWLEIIPGVSYVTIYYRKAMEWIVTIVNGNFLHVKEVLNMNGNGSGDTSYAWAEFYTIIILSLIIAGIWSVFDKSKEESKTLSYWLHNLIRYNIIMAGLNYGIIKIFAMQMPFPNLSQLATPLGDFLPMRFSWLFIGYSQPYEMFSGVIEIIVGLLLLYRRTIPLGLIVGLGVFTNVFLLNMCYDIPVKLYSMQIVICCLFLLAIDYQKYLNFFIFSKPTVPTTAFAFRFTKKWKRVGRIVLKTAFILLVVVWNLYDCYNWHKETNQLETAVIPYGVYNIKTLKKNNQVTPIDLTDTLAWKDFVFDKGRMGSIKTCDTVFRTRYGRGYFVYEANKSKRTPC